MNVLHLNSYTLSPNLPFVLMRTVHYANHEVLPHSHDFYELTIVQKGKAYHVCKGQEAFFSAGAIFIIPPQVKHYYKDFEHLVLINIAFTREMLESLDGSLLDIPAVKVLFAESSNAPRAVELENLIELIADADEIINEQKLRQPGKILYLKTLFYKLLIKTARYCHYGYVNTNCPEIAIAVSYMEKHYKDKITLEILASHCKLSVPTFRRTFHAAVGLSPIDYLLKLRIYKAAQMLESGDLSVSEIAFATGFNDSNYFGRQFKKIIGVSPSTYQLQDHKASVIY